MNRIHLKNKIFFSQSDVILIVIVVILVTTYFFLKLFAYNALNILYDYAYNKSMNLANNLINDSLNNIINKNDYKLLISENEIINFDNSKINNILIEFSDILYKKIDTINSENRIFFVPFGTIFNINTLGGIGPKIPFKIEMLGNSNNEIKTNIKEYGINNSLIEVELNVKVDVQVVIPFKTNRFEINKKIILDSKIIEGKIPQYYGGIIRN